MFNMFQAQQPQGPQVIDPRAQYEQQSLLADTMLQNAQQYQGGGALGALAMIANAYGANKMGERAQGSLTSILEQEQAKAQAAAKAEARAVDDERDFEMRKIAAQAAAQAENRAPPAVIQYANDMNLQGPERAAYIRSATAKAGGPTVNVNSGPQGPQRDGDFAFVPDPNSPAGMRAAVIPGTETYLEQQRASEGGAAATNEQAGKRLYEDITSNVTADNINAIADDVMGKIGPWSAGAGSHLSFIGGTPAAELEIAIRPLQSEQVTGKIEEMKDQSATGATGFGSMNEPELNLLLAANQALDPRRPPHELAEAVDNWRTQWNVTNQINELTRRVEAGDVPIEEATRVGNRLRQEALQRRKEIENTDYRALIEGRGNQPAQGQRPPQGQSAPAGEGSQISSSVEELLRSRGI